MLTRFGHRIGVAIEHPSYPLILSSQYPQEQALATGIYQAFKIVACVQDSTMLWATLASSYLWLSLLKDSNSFLLLSSLTPSSK